MRRTMIVGKLNVEVSIWYTANGPVTLLAIPAETLQLNPYPYLTVKYWPREFCQERQAPQSIVWWHFCSRMIYFFLAFLNRVASYLCTGQLPSLFVLLLVKSLALLFCHFDHKKVCASPVQTLISLPVSLGPSGCRGIRAKYTQRASHSLHNTLGSASDLWLLKC